MIAVAHIDLGVQENCQFKCSGCSHASPTFSPWSMPLAMIERDLFALKPFFEIGSTQILGGEPLLHPQIVDVLRLVKLVRADRECTVITNGALLPKMPDDFWRELEILQISLYPGKPDHRALVEEKQKQFGFAWHCTQFDSFYRQLKSVPDDGVEAFRNCRWKSDCLTVHRGHLYLCSQSAFFPKALGLPNTDGLPLEGLTEEKLRTFLYRTEPLKTCKNCLAHSMQTEPWKEAKRSEWLKESTTNLLTELVIADSIPSTDLPP